MLQCGVEERGVLPDQGLVEAVIAHLVSAVEQLGDVQAHHRGWEQPNGREDREPPANVLRQLEEAQVRQVELLTDLDQALALLGGHRPAFDVLAQLLPHQPEGQAGLQGSAGLGDDMAGQRLAA